MEIMLLQIWGALLLAKDLNAFTHLKRKSIRLKMNPENRWIKKAETIPWNEIEEQYASLFPSETEMPAKPLQTALDSLLIQKQYDYSDRELVEQIRENPHYQYFIGLPGYQDEIPFVPSLLIENDKPSVAERVAEATKNI